MLYRGVRRTHAAGADGDEVRGRDEQEISQGAVRSIQAGNAAEGVIGSEERDGDVSFMPMGRMTRISLTGFSR
jgi:hypothetical protein